MLAAQHKAIARKTSQPKFVPGVMGMDLEKAKAMQSRIDDFTNRMSDLLRIERDSELEFTQEELNAVPAPVLNSEEQKPFEFLVSHAQPEQELCDTICNLTAVSTSIGEITFSHHMDVCQCELPLLNWDMFLSLPTHRIRWNAFSVVQIGGKSQIASN